MPDQAAHNLCRLHFSSPRRRSSRGDEIPEDRCDEPSARRSKARRALEALASCEQTLFRPRRLRSPCMIRRPSAISSSSRFRRRHPRPFGLSRAAFLRKNVALEQLAELGPVPVAAEATVEARRAKLGELFFRASDHRNRAFLVGPFPVAFNFAT